MFMNGLLLFAVAISGVRADFGPYEQSADYDDGWYGGWPTESFRSTPVIGLSLNILQSSDLCDEGYTVLAPEGNAVRTPGPMIVDKDGHLVWTKQYGQTRDVNIYQFKGDPYLTFCVGSHFAAGYGDASTCYMLDSSYEEAYKIRGANNFTIDLNEFHITRNDTALLTVRSIIPADFEAMDRPEEGRTLDGIFQEVNIETGELIFQWQASEHFNVTEAYDDLEETDDEETLWDFFHISGVDKDEKGNFLVSSASLDCVVYVDGKSGDVIWKLGGKDNMFEDSEGNAPKLNQPYRARFADDGKAITLFESTDSASRGLYLDIDQEKMTVEVRYQYLNPTALTTKQGGSTQVLDNGNVLVSYGSSAAWTEYSLEGDPLCEVHFGSAWQFNDDRVGSLHVNKHAWTGYPKTQPTLKLIGYEAIVSWNGATEVVTWVLEGSNTVPSSHDKDPSARFNMITAQIKDGYETVLSIPPDTSEPMLRVLAFDKDGNQLGSSVPVAWNPTADEMAAVGAMSSAQKWRLFVFFLVGFSSAAALGVGIWVLRRRLLRRAVKLEPSREEFEQARVGWKSADPEYNGDEHLSDDEVGLLVENDDEADSPRSSVEKEPLKKEGEL